MANIDIETVVDREKIRDCLARYCHAIDRRDTQLLRSCFWPEAKTNYGIHTGSSEEFIEFAMGVLSGMMHTLHALGHSLIEVEGDRAVAETCVTAYHRVESNGAVRDIVLGARYLDRLERRNLEWRVADRVLVNDWLRQYEDAVDWSQGMLGLPFLNQQAVGKSHGDYSEALFARKLR